MNLLTILSSSSNSPFALNIFIGHVNDLTFITNQPPFPLVSIEAVGKRPSAVRQAHGPEQSRRAALPSSLVTATYFYVRLIPRDFVPQQSLRDEHFPSASEKPVFRQFYLCSFAAFVHA
jgi:hypothetical protein